MASPAHKAATYDDILALPEHVKGEIIAGELFVSPRPASPHIQVAAVLGMDLGAPFQRGKGGPGGWWILPEPELHLGAHVLVPDLAGWTVARMPSPPRDVGFYTLAPDWICEITSPRTAATDRVRKLPIYGEEGIKYAWLVNPIDRTIEAFVREGTRWILSGTFAGDEPACIEPFDAVPLDLAALWVASPPLPDR